jgi:Stage II sporulation protein E (SpoIIE)
MNTQLATAAQIQRRLLPAQPSTVDGIKCAVRFEPAWEIGGDFYDFIPLGRDRMLIALVDARQGIVTYANAGHPPAIIAGSSVRVLNTAGPPAGMFDRAVYTSDTRTLNPGDLTIILTDGISEALGGSGTSIVTLVAGAWPAGQPSAVCDAIMAYARSADGQSGVEDWTDDRTVVAFQWEGREADREGSKQHGNVDDNVRARVVDNRVPADDAA